MHGQQRKLLALQNVMSISPKYLDHICSRVDPASVSPRDHHSDKVKGVGESQRSMLVSFLTPFSVGITELRLHTDKVREHVHVKCRVEIRST